MPPLPSHLPLKKGYLPWSCGPIAGRNIILHWAVFQGNSVLLLSGSFGSFERVHEEPILPPSPLPYRHTVCIYVLDWGDRRHNLFKIETLHREHVKTNQKGCFPWSCVPLAGSSRVLYQAVPQCNSVPLPLLAGSFGSFEWVHEVPILPPSPRETDVTIFPRLRLSMESMLRQTKNVAFLDVVFP